jgi:hypothetical protein
MTGLEAIPKISELLTRLIKLTKDRETGALVQQIQEHQLEIHTALVVADAKIRELEKQLAEAQAEQVRIHKGIEFRRGKRTNDKWIGFCPKCHMPAQDAWTRPRNDKIVVCTASCGWQVWMELKLDDIITELGA